MPMKGRWWTGFSLCVLRGGSLVRKQETKGKERKGAAQRGPGRGRKDEDGRTTERNEGAWPSISWSACEPAGGIPAPCTAVPPRLSSLHTYLHGVRRAELHLSQVPGSTLRLVRLPELLVKAGPVPSIEGEAIVIPLLEPVIKGQAAGHGGRGHWGDELRHLLEVLDVHRVHVHVVA